MKTKQTNQLTQVKKIWTQIFNTKEETEPSKGLLCYTKIFLPRSQEYLLYFGGGAGTINIFISFIY